jgi:hypothetical protein
MPKKDSFHFFPALETYTFSYTSVLQKIRFSHSGSTDIKSLKATALGYPTNH